MAVLEIKAPAITRNGLSEKHTNIWGQLHLERVPAYDHNNKPILPHTSGFWTWYPSVSAYRDRFWGHCETSDYGRLCNQNTARGHWKFEHDMQFTLWADKPEQRFAMFLGGLLPLKIASGYTGIGYLVSGHMWVQDEDGDISETEGNDIKFWWEVLWLKPSY